VVRLTLLLFKYARLREVLDRKALAKGMSPTDVADLTELTLEEIQKLAH